MNLVLKEHCLKRSVAAIPRILVTKQVGSGPNFKGGVGSWKQIRQDIENLLGDTNAAGITTLIDYYGLPNDVPGMAARKPKASSKARVDHVEAAMSKDIANRRFRPYLMLHELEAMLFADIAKWQHRFEDAAIAKLKRDVKGLEPEEINETPHGAPSKRILRRLETYQKPLHGPDSLNDIGLEAIRDACPHFDEWLTWVEELGDDAERNSNSGRDDEEPKTRKKKRR